MSESLYQRILAGREALCFLHIPRTGGTSMRGALETYFHRRDICPWQTADWFDRVPAEQWRGFRLYSGHFDIDFPQRIGCRPLLMTMLRDPVRSAVSAFRDAQQQSAVGPGETLRSWAASDGGRSMATRFRRQLIGDSQRLLRELPDDETVAMAIENIEQMLFVGLTEQFDVSMQVLSHTMGWSCPPAVPWRNLLASQRTPRDAETEAAEAAVAELVAVERPIFERARELLAVRQDRMVRELLDGAARARLCRLARIDHYELDLDGAVPGGGWQTHEALQPESPMRWTGPGNEATLDLPLAQDRTLSLLAVVAHPYDHDAPARLEVLVNEHPVPVHRHELSPGRCLLGALLPQHVLRLDPDLTRIRFRWQRSTRPCDVVAGSTDDRLVGVLFEKLTIAPQRVDANVAGTSGAVPQA